MLLRAIRSVDVHLNSKFGPYPIHILVAKDYTLDPRGKDGPYTDKDRALIHSWAPASEIRFVEINMYSEDALEPGTNKDQILSWRHGKDGAVAGRDLGYTSMCRLWSGRLQGMDFLDPFQYYMRMDDDSLLIDDFDFDPFQRMKHDNLEYAFYRTAFDDWGVDQLWKISQPLLDTSEDLPFVEDSGEYSCLQPYNNFHVSRIDFWRSHQWQKFWKAFNDDHLFFKYRVGDANVHAIALMAMDPSTFQHWPLVPYVHNSNDYGPSWGTKAWVEECQKAYERFSET